MVIEVKLQNYIKNEKTLAYIFFLQMFPAHFKPKLKKKKIVLTNMRQMTGLVQSYWPPGGQTLDGKVRFAGKGFSEQHLLQ